MTKDRKEEDLSWISFEKSRSYYKEALWEFFNRKLEVQVSDDWSEAYEEAWDEHGEKWGDRERDSFDLWWDEVSIMMWQDCLPYREAEIKAQKERESGKEWEELQKAREALEAAQVKYQETHGDRE